MRDQSIVCALLLMLGVAARAQTPSASAGANAFDFDLGGAQAAAPAPVDAATLRRFEDRVRLRRRLLVAHQVGGFATLGLLAATLVVGTLSYVDKYGSGADTGQYLGAHEGLAAASSVAFLATGIFALAAPNPYPKPLRFDAALVHKVSMALAAACFVTQLVLGPVTASSDGKLSQRPLAAAHLGVGYGAFAFMSIGTLSYVFK